MKKMMIITVGAILALLATVAETTAPVVAPAMVYNASPSMPTGFYRRITAPASVGAVVTVRARDVAPAYAALRHFDGPRNYFIKRIAAGPGVRVCAHGDGVSVGGVMLRRQLMDRHRHVLPHWHECRRLGPDEFFLAGETDDSFDSRYFGPVNAAVIAAVWAPIS